MTHQKDTEKNEHPSVQPHDLKILPEDGLQDKYIIPLQYRKMENMHIVFWLFKDVAWCMGLTWLGISMIVPTLAISIIIAYRTRKYMSELCHNLAITVWISANSYWMISEFLGFDTKLITGTIRFKDLALIPFTMGLCILGFYYLIWEPRNKNKM